MPISATVNLSPMFGPARSQGQRRTCVAFAMSDLNRFHAGCEEFLSAEHLYCSAAGLAIGWVPNRGMTISSGIAVLKGSGQPTEAAAPYSNVEPSDIPPAVPVANRPFYKQDFASGRAMASDVITSLDHGIPVGLMVLLTSEFYVPDDGLIKLSTSAIANSYHAVLACGHGTDAAGESLVLLRNSWGETWGNGGYAWVAATYIDQYAVCSFRVL